MLVSGFDGKDAAAPSVQALAAQIRRGEVGGVVFVKDNIGSRDEVTGLTSLFRANAPRPVLLAIDHEGGAVQRLLEAHGCERLPAALEVAAHSSPDAARELYERAGRQIARLGFNLNLGPVVDLHNPDNPAIGHFGRAYGADPEVVATYAAAFVDGFAAASIPCVLKHFPGQGGATTDSHFGLADLGSSWSDRDLAPFRRLIREKRAAAVLAGYATHAHGEVDDQPAALSPALLNGLLRGSLGFEGVVMTDDLDMGAVGFGFDRPEVTLKALRAGNDLLMIRNRKNADLDLPQSLASWIAQALTAGELSTETLERSAARVLTLRSRV